MEEKKKTLLERIIEQEAQKIAQAIEQAISDGEAIEPCPGGIKIAGECIFINKYDKSSSVVLCFKSNAIFAEYLKIQRAELEMLKEEIEEKLKELE